MTVQPTTEVSPHQHLLGLLGGKMVAAALCVLARIGVADELAHGPLPVAELARRTGCHPPTLYRFLRATASVGVFAETPGGDFALTPAAELLRSDVPGTLRYLAYLYGETSVWNCFGSAIDTLRTGEPSGPALRGGKGWFEYMAGDPEYAEVFHLAMTGVSERATAVAAAYDFDRFATVADIGGGQGRLLAAILNRNPGQRGILFDTASAIGGAEPVLSGYGVADRVERVVGDFFASVPPGADAYVLKAILHDWNDRDALRILRNIRTALAGRPDGRVLIVEAVVPGDNDWHYSKLMDLAMAVSLGGQERDAGQWRSLLAEAGFELCAVTETAPPHCVIEARPVDQER
ncbi:acetylserotonin O-methyltransferase [Crossiella sp. SN42]|uniref:acetylserotonin O-methyltransferase n=1 Tax=Crossiella sp. SN42 TaxID=2944808 RepID=UPI00207C6F2D|nr:acetylserotonin O-methyltransferase [Crossiella sp. SN42]MCO1580360.1 acetylserotonin O-methyltransferase [Crossiella sp. SN42]